MHPTQLYIDRMAIVGLWKDRADLEDTESYIRNLRRGTRRRRTLKFGKFAAIVSLL